VAYSLVQQASRGSSTQNHGVTFANAPVEGELIVICFRIATIIATVTTASGWQRVDGATINDADVVPTFSEHIYFKIAGAGEGTAQTPATTVSNFASIANGTRWSGNAAIPGDASNEAANAAGQGSHQPGSVTPSEGGELIVTISAQSGNNNGSEAIDSDFIILTENGNSTIIGYKIKGAADTAAENPTFSHTGSTRHASGIATFLAAAGDATATPAVVAVPVSITNPTASASSTPTPSAIPVPTALGAPTIAASSTATPTTIPVPVTLDAPSVSTSSTPTPTTVPVPVSITDPTVSVAGDATASPATIAVPVGITDPTASASSTPTPAAIAVLLAITNPSVSASSTVVPTTVPVPATLDTPTISASATATPSTVSVLALITDPAVQTDGNVTVSPATIPVPVTLGAPTVSTSSTVSPSTILVPVSITDPAVSTITTAAPTTIAITVTLAAPSLATDSTITPATISATVSLATPTIRLISGTTRFCAVETPTSRTGCAVPDASSRICAAPGAPGIRRCTLTGEQEAVDATATPDTVGAGV